MKKGIIKNKKTISERKMRRGAKILIAILAGIIVLSGAMLLPGFVMIKKAEWKEYQEHLIQAKSVDVREYIGEEEPTRDNYDSYEGVGITFVIPRSKPAIITEIADNSPASLAGLSAGDVIISIDGRYTSGMDVEHISNILKGPKGTKVSLLIYRDSFDGKAKKFSITRDVVDDSYRREYLKFLNSGEGGEDLGNGYWRYSGRVYYWSSSDALGDPRMHPTEADPGTFMSFKKDYCPRVNEDGYVNCPSFGKDKDKVFWGDSVIEKADPETFQVLGKGYYGKDKNLIFFADDRDEAADVQTFEIIFEEYCPHDAISLAKDKDGYIFQNFRITKSRYYEEMRSWKEKEEREGCY